MYFRRIGMRRCGLGGGTVEWPLCNAPSARGCQCRSVLAPGQALRLRSINTTKHSQAVGELMKGKDCG